MSTIEAVAIGWKAARQAKREARARHAGIRTATDAVGGFLRRVGQASLSILGLGSLVAAAFTVALPLGLAAAGVAFFLLEWRLAE